jgi:hypothetical protein
VPLTAIQKLAGHASIKMTLRYAHLSPRYLADEVKALDRVQQEGKPHTDSGAEQAALFEKDQRETESAGSESAEDATPDAIAGLRRSPRNRQAVKAGKPGQPMRGIDENRQSGKTASSRIAKLLNNCLLR